jgi:hypothetical protein
LEVDGLGGGGGSKAPWRRVVDEARKRVLVVAPAVVVIVIVGGFGVRSCATDSETENVVAAGEHEPGSDGDGDTDGAGNGGRRGSDKDGVSDPTSTSVDTSTATTAGRGVTTTLGTSPSPAAPPQPGRPAGPGPGGGETTTTAGEPAGDRTPPSISSLAGGGNIGAPVPGVACQYPTSTTLAARVSDDDSGVGSVVAYWSTSRHSGSIKLNPDGQGNFIGTLGPIQDQGPFPLPVAWYVEARDLAGNSARLDASDRAAVTLRECQPLG